MHRNRVVAIISRRSLIIGTVGALVLLWGVLSGCQANEIVVQTAIAQTAAAETEDASAFGTAVAAEVATQVSALTDSTSGAGTEGENTEECGPECDTRVAELVEATAEQAMIDATATQEQLDAKADESLEERLTREAREAAETAQAGGGEEEDACADGTLSCATNNTDSNVNVREGPGVQWPFMTVIPPEDDKDTVVVICRLQNGWLHVILSLSLKINGWVSGEFMKLTGPTPDICEEIPPTPVVFPTVTPTPTPTPTHTPTVTPTPTETPKPPIFVLAFNGSSVDVCRLEVFPATNSSGNNRLGSSERLEPLQNKAVSLDANAQDKNYVFRAWECAASNPDTDPPLDEAVLKIDAGMTWTITDP